MSNEKDMNWEEYRDSLLEGLDGTERQVTKTVLNNYLRESMKQKQASGIISESGTTGSTVTSNFDRYDRIFMPLMRRVTPSLLSMDLVGNQPLTGPTGLVRTLRFRYSQEGLEGTGGPEAGTEASGWGADGADVTTSQVFEKYSQIAVGEDYDADDTRDRAEQTIALEGDGGQPMSADVTNYTVTAGTRKLSAVWSLESEQDSEALDGLDLESELVSALSDEIARELDREMLYELKDLAGHVENFDFANADGRYAGERFTGLSIGFSELSNQISVRTRRGGATWMVVSPKVLTAMRHAADGSFTPASAGQDISPRDSLFAGTFNGNVRVYVDLYAGANDNYALMGYKGSSDLDTGFVYCPYVPVMSSGRVVDPTSFDPRMSLMTRYAFAKFTDYEKNLGNSPDYYARANISNLELGFKSE